MFRYSVITAYLSFLLIAGTTMTSALNQTDHTNATQLQSNICRLLPDSATCADASRS